MREALQRALCESEMPAGLAYAARELGLPDEVGQELHALHRQTEGELFRQTLELMASVYARQRPGEVETLSMTVVRAAFRAYANMLLFIDGRNPPAGQLIEF